MPDPTPFETASAALSRLANARRTRITEYANLAARPGESVNPRRLVSDVGFFAGTQFGYITAHNAHLTAPEDDAPRAISRIVFAPYGVNRDRARLTSRRTSDRLVGTRRGDATVPGVCPIPSQPLYVAPAYIDANTYAQSKTDRAVRDMASRLPGPAYHALIDRQGGVTIGPAIDFRTAVNPEVEESAIFIGLEGALAMPLSEFRARSGARIFELPYTGAQLASLATLVNKLLTALPGVPRVFSADNPGLNAYSHSNFSSGRWRTETDSPFEYGPTDDAEFLDLIIEQGVYDLATEVFRPIDAPRAVVGRREMQTAIGRVDTAGERSLLLGAYVDIAAPERTLDMLSLTREQIFAHRRQVTHTEADEAGTSAGHAAAGEVLSRTFSNATNIEPHVYNYATGRWGDGGVT